MSALTWAQTERWRGVLATNASMVFVVLCIAYGFDVKVAVHIAGKENIVCDRLSRLSESGGSTQSVMTESGLGETEVVDLGRCHHTRCLLAACNPAVTFSTEEDFLLFWGGIRDTVRGLGIPAE